MRKIVSDEPDNLVIVVSAFGKTTNALENVLKAWLTGEGKYTDLLDEVYDGHLLVIKELFGQDRKQKGKLISHLPS